jgi:hypothetical protein
MGGRFEALCSPGGAEANLAAMPPMPLTSSSR